jgi:hypothetical protein
MKAYTYTASECGLKRLPPGTLRLGGFEPTTNPAEADVFIVPCDIKHLTNAQIHALPYLAGHEARHALFCIHDQPSRVLGLPAIIFRADANAGILAGDPTTIPWPWPVNPKGDIDAYIPLLRDGFTYDVTFVGWNSTPLTEKACEAVAAHPNLSTFIKLNSEFYGTWESRNDVEKVVNFRNLFLARMQESRLSLCARSIAAGVVRYRFYEAMAMARIPVHLNDHAALPFAKEIDWDKCAIHVDEGSVENLGRILRGWLDEHSDREILERGTYGRAMWGKWLDGRKWDDLFGYCAMERLAGRM